MPKNTSAFYAQSVASFVVAMAAVVVGILALPVDPWIRGFLSLGMLYTVTSAFTLAKCIRDRQEDNAVTKRVDQARLDKLITEHDPFKADHI
ncbi:MAG: YiaA/YiaB family inner membrane protein [Kibdelosporangium sp.]